MSRKNHKIFIIAGEPSGDFIGSRLLASLKKLPAEFTFLGVGGELMEEQGLKTLVPLSSFSVMGIFENLSKARRLYKILKDLKKRIRQEKPDLLITIDFPGFNFKLGKMLRDSGIPHMHYVGPTVWAWRPWRAKKIARFLSHLCVLFPFEPPYFERHGLPTTFVGHPLLEIPLRSGSAQNFRNKIGIPEDTDVLLCLPGSRGGELAHHLPILQETFRKLASKGRKFHIVIPTLESLRNKIPLSNWGAHVTLITNVQEKYDAYAAASGALAVSGTIALELALANVPMLITYKTNPLTLWLARKLIKVKYACMVNILLDQPIIEEYIQENCSSEKLLQGLEALLNDNKRRNLQHKAFGQLERCLSPKAGMPSDAAAKAAWELLEGKGSQI